MSTPDPTRDQFAAYSAAFDYFNEALFGNELPRCLLNFSRHARARGFFAPLRWGRADGRTHEISLNPDLLSRPAALTMGTLVHEMVHLWQQEFGKPSRTNYHNRQWADRMERAGLMPSDTGKPGGKRTGQGMTHYIIEGGPFAAALAAMPAEYLLPWTSAACVRETARHYRLKVKYTCPACAANAWGKPGLAIVCGDCLVPFISELAGAELAV